MLPKNDNKYILLLIRKVIDKTITDDELLQLRDWGMESSFNADLLRQIEDESLLFQDVKVWFELRDNNKNWLNDLESRTLQKIKPSHFFAKIAKNKYLNIAAIFISILGLSIVGYRIQHTLNTPEVLTDLKPGSNKATITLSDGRTISLSDQQEGIVFGESINYKDGTLLEDIEVDKLVYAILKTPKGGHYQITLSDGTHVWLNADSKLKYPLTFKGKERVVELQGEGYFDVKHSMSNGIKAPFIVKTAQQMIQVLGTQFNVNAYDLKKKSIEKTTLVEGMVSIGTADREFYLKPGEQGLVSIDNVSKKKVDISQYIAWKENKFIFEDTDLREALDVLGRWYDFEYLVQNKEYNVQLYANISRQKNLKEVLNILKTSDIKFRLEKKGDENKLIIIN